MNKKRWQQLAGINSSESRIEDPKEKVLRVVRESLNKKYLREEDEEEDAVEDIDLEGGENIEDLEGGEDLGTLEGGEDVGEVGNPIEDIQAALTQAFEAAKSLGDEKLSDQIGNTITFFTRNHVVKVDDDQQLSM